MNFGVAKRSWSIVVARLEPVAADRENEIVPAVLEVEVRNELHHLIPQQPGHALAHGLDGNLGAEVGRRKGGVRREGVHDVPVLFLFLELLQDRVEPHGALDQRGEPAARDGIAVSHPTRIRLTPFSRMNFFISSSVLM